MKYYLSLGSNINAEENIAFAIKELKKILSNVIISSTHKTKAEGFEGDDFLNLVLVGDSTLDFESLNKKLKIVEDTSGRKRDVPKFSARTLDIDIVLQIDLDEIVFESDEIKKYLFVSEPLKELIWILVKQTSCYTWIMKKGSFLTKHLRAIDKSYFEHLKDALYYGFRLLIGGIGAILHAIFPFILTTIASDTINDLHKMNINRLSSDD